MVAESLCAVLHGPKDIRIETWKIDSPACHEVQIAIRCTGLCGSDVHFFQHATNGVIDVKMPLILGHEASGEVVAVGKSVTHLKIKDRVAIEAGIPCGECRLCKEGRYNICPTLKFCASAKFTPHVNGTLTRLMNRPAQWCHKMPENVSYVEAALAEPLSVVFHAMRRVQLQPGQAVLIIGAGAIGLMACQMAKLFGAADIVIADIVFSRLDFAKQHGLCSDTFLIPEPPAGMDSRSNVDYVKTLACKLQRYDFAVTLECTGQASSVQLGLESTRQGGRIALIGMGSSLQTLEVSPILSKEIDVIGVFRYANTYPTALNMIARGAIKNLDSLVTHEFGLEDSRLAFDAAAKGEYNGIPAIKVMISES